jgi:hypothetical protein
MRLVLALALTSTLAAGAFIAPAGWRHLQLLRAADDPVALSDLRVGEVATVPRIAAELDAALLARDADLAQSFVTLAQERGISVAPEQLQRLHALKEGSVGQAVADFGHGFVAGDREGGAAFVGALTGDVIGFGDLRDLALEGRKWLDGQEADTTVVALAAAGLALSAVTFTSLGSLLPVRNGLSVVKSASKAKVLSPALTASLGRTAAQAVDRPALTASMAAVARLDLAAARGAARGIVRPAAMTRLTALGQDAGTLYARTGQRGVRQVLAVADDAADIRRAAKLAAGKGSTMRATLKLLGRGALVLGTLSLTAIGWSFALIGYAIALAMLAQRFGWWLGRRRWLGGGRKRKAARPEKILQPA